jgi:hypothetical protein
MQVIDLDRAMEEDQQKKSNIPFSHNMFSPETDSFTVSTTKEKEMEKQDIKKRS